jgi:hypothetical protein
VFEDEHSSDRSLPETGIEVMLRYQWYFLGLTAVIGAGGNVAWARGVLGAFGMLGPILVLAYRNSAERAPGRIGLPYALLMLPWWIGVTAFLSGLANPLYESQLSDKIQYWELLPLPSPWVPVSGEPKTAALALLLSVGLYAAAVNAFLLARNRIAYARSWVGFIWGAGLVGAIGVVQKITGTGKILWFAPIGNPTFFADFPHRAQWCAFAILWLGAALGLAAWLVRQRSWRWLNLDGWSFLTAAGALALSIAFAGDPLHWLLGSLVAAAGCFVLGWQTWADRPRGKGPGMHAIVCSSIGAAFVLVAIGVALRQNGQGWIAYAGDHPGNALHNRLLHDVIALCWQRPWFGWGTNSFGIVYSLFQQADLGLGYWAYARSDLLQSFFENGIIGTLAWCLPAIVMVLRLFRTGLRSFLWAPVAGLLAVAILAIVDFPFACPAVFFCFWLLLFTVARWTEVDDENHKSKSEDRRVIERTRRTSSTIAAKETAPSATA